MVLAVAVLCVSLFNKWLVGSRLRFAVLAVEVLHALAVAAAKKIKKRKNV